MVLSVDEREKNAGVMPSTFKTVGIVASRIFREIQFATNDALTLGLPLKDASVLVGVQNSHANGHVKQRIKSVLNRPNQIPLEK